MKTTLSTEAAQALSAEMMIYEARMAEIAELLDGVVVADLSLSHRRYLGKAATLAEEAERLIFGVRNTLSVAMRFKLVHRLNKEGGNES